MTANLLGPRAKAKGRIQKECGDSSGLWSLSPDMVLELFQYQLPFAAGKCLALGPAQFHILGSLAYLWYWTSNSSLFYWVFDATKMCPFLSFHFLHIFGGRFDSNHFGDRSPAEIPSEVWLILLCFSAESGWGWGSISLGFFPITLLVPHLYGSLLSACLLNHLHTILISVSASANPG